MIIFFYFFFKLEYNNLFNFSFLLKKDFIKILNRTKKQIILITKINNKYQFFKDFLYLETIYFIEFLNTFFHFIKKFNFLKNIIYFLKFIFNFFNFICIFMYISVTSFFFNFLLFNYKNIKLYIFKFIFINIIIKFKKIIVLSIKKKKIKLFFFKYLLKLFFFFYKIRVGTMIYKKIFLLIFILFYFVFNLLLIFTFTIIIFFLFKSNFLSSILIYSYVLFLNFLYFYFLVIKHFYIFSKIFIKHIFYVFNHFLFFLKFLYKSYFIFLKFIFTKTYLYAICLNYINFFNFSYIFYFICIISSFLFKSYLGFYGIFCLNLISSFSLFLSSFFNLNFFLFENKKLIIEVFKWFSLNEKDIIYFDIYIDNISFSFVFLTISIALFVNIYLFSYFRYEPYLNRLIILINLFVFSMILLVSAGNTIVFFLGWELIGITSFFLINFWFYRTSTLKAALKAFTFNKYSDACIFISIILMYNIFNTFNYTEFFDLILLKNEVFFNLGNNFFYLNIVSFFLLNAAFVKSAQFGFHIWLPDSMEAPVPASALIHSATLVSAGIFLILRYYPILEFSFFSNFLLVFTGSITAFLGGFAAASQTDLKKILAYSTISHCGFLVYLCSFGDFKYVLIYLFVHGLFKAISFLCIGNIIRFSKNYQDIRRMGFFFKYLPLEFFFLNISLLNLSGLPFLFGFYSKHFLFLNNDYIYLKEIVQSLIFLSGITGIFYSFKIIYFCFFDSKKSKKNIFFEFNDNNLIENKYFTNSGNLSSIFIFIFLIFSYFILFFFFYYLNNLNCEMTDFNIFFVKFEAFFYLNNDFNTLYNFSIFYYFSFFIIIILIIINLKKKLFIFEMFEFLYLF